MRLYVKFWGTRGSTPTPGQRTHKYGGNTPCVEVSAEDTLIICDAGSGIRELGLDLMKRPTQPVVGHMLFSHTHWDHIQGFPFFVPVYIPQSTFYVYGTSPGDDRFYQLLSGQMQSDYFPVNFNELNAKIDSRHLEPGQTLINDIIVRCCEQNHPGKSFAYSFDYGKARVVYATDFELDQLLDNPEHSMKHPDEQRLWNESLLDFYHGADLLITDGQYTDEEYPGKIGWGHSRANSAVDFAVQA